MACSTVPLMPRCVFRFLYKLFCCIDVEHDFVRLIRYDPKDTRSFLIFNLDVAKSSSSSSDNEDDDDNVTVRYIMHRNVARASVDKLFKNSTSSNGGPLKMSSLRNCGLICVDKLFKNCISSKGGPLKMYSFSNCGLICVYNEVEFCIANPLKEEEGVHLPHPRLSVDHPHPPPPRLCGGSNIEHCVLVFHPGRNEYILVAFFPEGTRHGFLFYRTFTLGISKSWSAAGMALYPVSPRDLVPVGGSLYWVHREGIDCRVIVSFDVSEDKFRDIHTVWGEFYKTFLMESCGSLFLVSEPSHDTLGITFIRDPLNDYTPPPPPQWQNIIIPLNILRLRYAQFSNVKPICIQNGYVVLNAQWRYYDSHPDDRERYILKPETIVYDIMNQEFFSILEYHDLCAVDVFMPMPASLQVSLLPKKSLQVSSLLIGGRNVSKVMETPYLLEEILSRVPPRFISKLRRVSKLWCTRIDDPKFITLCYENYIRKSPLYLVTYSAKHNGISLLHLLDASNDLIWRPKELVPAASKFGLQLSGSTCNGLICLYNHTQVFVCNPMTREVLSLPSIEVDNDFNYCLLTFVPTRGEYKVVCLCELGHHETGFIVFTLGVSKSWSSFTYSPHQYRFPCYPCNSKIMPMNGIVFCIQERELGGHIISFDVSDGRFDTIESPKEVYGVELFLGELQGRLSLARYQNFSKTTTIWTKDEDSPIGFWTQLADFRHGEYTFPRQIWKPLCIDKGKILFLVEEHSYQLMVTDYDIETKKFSFIHEIASKNYLSPLFMASLLSLNKFKEVMVD